MKLTVDLSHPKLPKLFWFALLSACLYILIWQMPITWVSKIVSSQSGCRVVLHQPIGTVWHGSAALAFSETNASEGGCREPHAVTERFYWSSACSFSTWACTSKLQFVALDKPQLISWGLKKTQITANEVKLPANILEGLGNPWSTLRPRGQLSARWTDLSFGGLIPRDLTGTTIPKSTPSGVIRIIITNLSSPISPVSPLGAYEILANIENDGLNWSLLTTSGPLLLRGQGDTKSGFHFDGDASASSEAQDSLVGLLALLGKKDGNSYRLKF